MRCRVLEGPCDCGMCQLQQVTHELGGYDVERREYRIDEVQGGHMTSPLKILVTECVSGCQHRYKIDEYHPAYVEVKRALDQHDRSVIHCYHKSLYEQMKGR